MQKAQLAKQKEQGVVLMAEHDHWLEDSDDSDPENMALMACVTSTDSDGDCSEKDISSPSTENEVSNLNSLITKQCTKINEQISSLKQERNKIKELEDKLVNNQSCLESHMEHEVRLGFRLKISQDKVASLESEVDKLKKIACDLTKDLN
ncbi:unnamed protein product [Cuscuta epithymum]|uniref:Uncharacterized protein n=1 Tax=Cuscuta epithymum TaxID=186058 RepID=A0AAV0EJ62_9ASTE|nr:unnamed protein product [Cuscuta epithymum]